MTAPQCRSHTDFRVPMVLGPDLSDRDEIDALHNEWAAAGAGVTDPPEAKPYKLYEFFAADIDGNTFRVFYDFSWEERTNNNS